MAKDIFIGHAVTQGMPFDPEAVSAAGNLAELGILSAITSAFGKAPDAFIYAPGRLWPRGRLFQSKSGHFRIGEVDAYVPPYIALPLLREICVSFFLFFYIILKVRANDRVWMYNLDIPSPLPVVVLSKLIGFKRFVFAYDVHIPGETVPRNARWVLRFIKYKLLIRGFDGVVAITKAIVRDFNVQTKSVVVHGGVQAKVVGVGLSRKASGPRIFLMAGRLDRDNSIEEILDAFKQLADKSVRLVVAGDGPLRQAVVSAAEMDARINYLGKINHQQVLDWYKKAYAVLCIRKLHSIRTPYLFPSKLLEGIASGTLVICTPIEFSSGELSDVALVLDDDSSQAVKRGIENALTLSNVEVQDICERAVSLASRAFLWEHQGGILRTLL